MCSLLAAKPSLGSLAIDWQNLTRLTKVLEPIVNLTKATQAAIYVAGDFYRDLLVCCCFLRDMDDSWGRKAFTCLENRTTPLTKTPEFMAALYLDPRFGNKQMTILSEREKSVVLVSYFMPLIFVELTQLTN